MAAHPGGLCAPRVRSEGNRNTAEPCTRLPGARRRDPSRFLRPDGPRLRPPALRPRQAASGARWRGDPGPSQRARPSLLQPRAGVSPQASHSGGADGLCGLPPLRDNGPAYRLPLLSAPCTSPKLSARREPRGEAGPQRTALSSRARSALPRWSLGTLEDFGWTALALSLQPGSVIFLHVVRPDLVGQDRWQPPS